MDSKLTEDQKLTRRAFALGALPLPACGGVVDGAEPSEHEPAVEHRHATRYGDGHRYDAAVFGGAS